MNCHECPLAKTCQVKYLFELGIHGYTISKIVCDIVRENELDAEGKRK